MSPRTQGRIICLITMLAILASGAAHGHTGSGFIEGALYAVLIVLSCCVGLFAYSLTQLVYMTVRNVRRARRNPDHSPVYCPKTRLTPVPRPASAEVIALEAYRSQLRNDGRGHG